MPNGQASLSSKQFYLAGILYALIIICGISSELLIRGPLLSLDSPEQLLQSITSSPYRYYLGFLLDLVMLTCDIGLAVLLFALFKPCSPQLSLFALLCRFLQACILGLNLTFYLIPLWLSLGQLPLPLEQIAPFTSFFLSLHSFGYDLGLIFFALCNFTLAALIIKSRLFSSYLAYALLISGLVYLCGSLLRFIRPDLSEALMAFYIIPLLSETAFCIYLLLKGKTAKIS